MVTTLAESEAAPQEKNHENREAVIIAETIGLMYSAYTWSFGSKHWWLNAGRYHFDQKYNSYINES